MPADADSAARPHLLIIALSGRALAEAARAAGFDAVVVDFFLDQDTRRASRLGFRMGGHWRRGFRRSALLPLARVLAEAAGPPGRVCGIVYGNGFEDRPGIIAALAARHIVFGNDAATVRRVKRPLALAALCREAGIPHPEVAVARPEAGAWLRKRAGGAGGVHVGVAGGVAGAPPGGCGWYWQQRLQGHPVSALFLADGARAVVLGFSLQWPDPSAEAPFRYGGAVRPVPFAVPEAAMTEAVRRLVARSGLRGLNSADFLAAGEAFHLIEVNPRPGASLDVFACPPLLRLHVEACQGRLPAQVPQHAGAMAARVVHAPCAARLPRGFAWPEWSADRGPGQDFRAGDPVCTVHAGAADANAARALAEARAAEILARMVPR